MNFLIGFEEKVLSYTKKIAKPGQPHSIKS